MEHESDSDTNLIGALGTVTKGLEGWEIRGRAETK